MIATKEEQKAKCVEILNKLDIYKPYIEGFEKKGRVCYFERFGGFWAFQDAELEAKMKAIEQKYNCMVYAITHDYSEFGELYSFLIVTSEKEEHESLVEDLRDTGNEFIAFAYVWNKDNEYNSEFGNVVVKSFAGGIARIA